MTDNTDKLIAEALVECWCVSEYKATESGKYTVSDGLAIWNVEPFADTLIGHRQKDALIDWLQNKHAMLWARLWVNSPIDLASVTWRSRQLQVIRACFKQLAEKPHD